MTKKPKEKKPTWDDFGGRPKWLRPAKVDKDYELKYVKFPKEEPKLDKKDLKIKERKGKIYLNGDISEEEE